MTKRLAITVGEPAGIGPDVAIVAAGHDWPDELVVIADPDMLMQRAQMLQKPLTLISFDRAQAPKPQARGTLTILPVACVAPPIPTQLDRANAAHVLRCLQIAHELCLQQQVHAWITGPVHKAHLQESGIPFMGHTEYLRDLCGVSHTVMLFVLDHLRIALATTHLPLHAVPNAITTDLLHKNLRVLSHALVNTFRIATPHIKVAGLNPHAGEDGHLGREEIDIITPALRRFKQDGITVSGPYPADTLFTPDHTTSCDAILAMYHDQALPLIKYLGFDRAVNVTLGLPYIRTSVDHGTALPLAGTGKANAGSMLAAIKLASHLVASS